MKAKIISAVFMLNFGLICFGQSIKENKIDEFTGTSIKRTSWEVFGGDRSSNSFFRISRVNDFNLFDLKLMLDGRVFSIGEGQELMLRLANDSIITLHNLEYAITCTGCGARGFVGSSAQGIQVSYIVDEEIFESLKNNIVIKYRVYTNNGYKEFNVNAKNASTLRESFRLIDR